MYPSTIETWCIKKTCYNLEIALNQKEKSEGLMHRTYLAPYRGMKFIWLKEEFRFMWMKNTLIPLDILWLDENKVILNIKEVSNINNESIIKSNKKAKYVIELPLGSSLKNNIKIGDKLRKLNF